MNRRSFLESSIASSAVVCGGGLSMAILAQSCTGVAHYAQSVPKDRSVDFSLDEFVDVENSKTGATVYRPFVMVQHPLLRTPIVVYRNIDATYVALSTACTHKGCQVRPSAVDLVCPCHGSEFDTKGKVLSPPASTDLITYPVAILGNTLRVSI